MPPQILADRHSLKILKMDTTNLPQNDSQHRLVPSVDDSSSGNGSLTQQKERRSYVTRRNKWTVGVLCFVNLINYMDRYTLAGVLEEIEHYYKIDNEKAGLLQTVFVLSYMVFAPLFGYLGDRHSRKKIMAFGVFLWSLTTLLGSFMDNFNWFMTFRAMVGIGEASYSTIAPTIISDLFLSDMRSKMLALFYFAIPVGSGLGYIAGSGMAEIIGSWHWALRLTPILGGIAVLLILFVMEDPDKGYSEGVHLTPTSWWDDIKSISKNPTFMLTTAGFTCVAFVTGALAWWGPMFIYYGTLLIPGHADTEMNSVSRIFGIIAMFAGIIGVPLGSAIAQKARKRWHQADPVICAIGLIASSPILFFAALLANKNITFCYIFMFIGQISLNLSWSIVADILLYVVIPTRRSTAEAFQILFSHAFGDAGSPYLIGLVSTVLFAMLKPEHLDESPVSTTPLPADQLSPKFYSLQYALFLTCFVEILGGIFFIVSAHFIERDKEKADLAIQAKNIELKIFLEVEHSIEPLDQLYKVNECKGFCKCIRKSLLLFASRTYAL